MDDQATIAPVLADNARCLREAIALLHSLSPEEFVRTHPAFHHASIGAHIRHNIDHFDNFFAGLPGGRIDYDRRARDPETERDPARACRALEAIATRLGSFPLRDLDSPCTIRVNAHSADASDPAHWSGSTVRRELHFLLGHAIHHHALVAAICRSLGHQPSPTFGMAPSSLRHKFRQAAATPCVR
ncbi:hypothetical protein BH23VER1_BH23VER1_11420 [soil metagenome]